MPQPDRGDGVHPLQARSASAFSGIRAAAAFPESSDFAAYRRLYAPGSDVERIDDGFHASVTTILVGSLVISRRVLGKIAHSRMSERIARNAFDHFTLGYVHSGKMEIQTERGRSDVKRGSAYLFDMTQPVRYVADAEVTTISVPRRLLPRGGIDSARLHGASVANASAAPLERWLALDSHLPGADSAFARMLDAVFGQNDADLVGSAEVDRQDRIRQLIETSLGDPDVPPAQLALLLGMSRATLYRAFRPLGSIQRWRQARRLLRFKAALAFGALPIISIAQNVGLEDPAHASNLFSKTFGLSPSRYRQAMSVSDESQDEASRLSWIFENIPLFMLEAGGAGKP